MVQICVSCGRKFSRGCGFIFFSFPKNDFLGDEWLKFCGLHLHPGNNTSKMKLCSDHFDESCFRVTRKDGPVILKPDAIPSLFGSKINQITKHVPSMNKQPECASTSEQQPVVKPAAALTPIITTPKKKRQIWRPRHGTEMSLKHFNSLRKALQNLNLIKEDIKKKDMRIKQLTQKTYRMRERIASLEQLVEHLQKKKLVV